MEAKLYGQNKGGMSINGIIKDYYAYAGENISAGDLVEYVNGVAGQTKETSENTQLISNSKVGYETSAVQLDESRVFIAHCYGTSTHLYGIVVTIDGTTITIGSDTKLSSTTGTGFAISTCLMPNGNVFIVHSYGGSHYLYGIVCTISGTTITAGTDTALVSSSEAGYEISTCLLDNGSVFIAHNYSENYYLYGIICTISGTTISKGSDTEIVNSTRTTGSRISIVKLNNGTVFIAHSYGSDYHLYGIICSVSGTTISKGSDTEIVNTSSAGATIATVKLNNGNVFIAYKGSSNSSLCGIICTISGTTISKGSSRTLSSVKLTGNTISTCLMPNGKVFVAHSYGENLYLYGIVCTVSGTTISQSSDTVLVSINTGTNTDYETIQLGNGNIFITHSTSTGDNLYAQIFSVENNIPTNQIPIPEYETQVRKVTTAQFDGIAKTSGEGGDATGHNDIVSIWTKPQGVLKAGNIFAKNWTKVSDTEYVAEDGTILTASSLYEENTSPNLAVDNDENTYWQADKTVGDLTIKLVEPIKVTKMKLRATWSDAEPPTYPTIQGSKNGADWIDLCTTTTGSFLETILVNADYYLYYKLSVFHPVSTGYATVWEWQTSEYMVLE